MGLHSKAAAVICVPELPISFLGNRVIEAGQEPVGSDPGAAWSDSELSSLMSWKDCEFSWKEKPVIQKQTVGPSWNKNQSPKKDHM